MIEALHSVGIGVSREPLNDISHPAGKIGGSAQLRTDNAVLRLGEAKISDKTITSAEKRVARMRDHADASRDDVIEALKTTFADRFDAELGGVIDRRCGRGPPACG